MIKLAFRLTLYVRPGRLGKAVELTQSVKKVVPDWKGRIYSSHYGPGDTLIFENVYESVSEPNPIGKNILISQNLRLGGMSSSLKELIVVLPLRSGI